MAERREFLERRVREVLSSELGQALVMVYCRHLHDDEAKAALRGLADREPALLAEFDALDALHAEVPFQDLGHLTLHEEIELLYWHQAQQGSPEKAGQLRRLCGHDPSLTAAFDRLERLRRRDA